MVMTDSVFRNRLLGSGLSLWELGDLLGIHPHHVGHRLDHLPCAVVIDLARRLDMHPADLVEGLDSVLANTRGASQPAVSMDTAATAAEPLPPVVTEAGHDAPATTPDGDADVVLAALAHAIEPLTTDELADALDWTLERVATAIGYAQRHPHLGGPVALRRTEPHTYTVTARLDRLSADQQHNLGQAHLYRNPLTTEQADALLAVLALRCAPDDYLSQRQDHLDAERDLKCADLIHAEHGPHRPEAHVDVLYSLRYWNTPDEH
jgi:hypothetical protein